jgi:uncharacterized membrane protein
MGRRPLLAGVRIGIAAVVGVVAGLTAGVIGHWALGPVVGWVAAAAVYLALVWASIRGMDAASTAEFATREDPTSGATRIILLIASMASLGGVALLLGTSGSVGRVSAGFLGVASVAASWLVVHTIYTLSYAALYYRGVPGGIDFNQQEAPSYADFAYLGFTMGMTYQVSDTAISDAGIRRVALRHALLAYLLGAVVLAITINLVVNLAR